MRRNQAYMILAQRLFSAINMNQVKFNKETQHYWMNTWMNNVPPKKKSLLSLTQYQRAWLYKAEISQRMDSMILFSSSSFFILCFSLSVSSWQEGNSEKEGIKEKNSKLKTQKVWRQEYKSWVPVEIKFWNNTSINVATSWAFSLFFSLNASRASLYSFSC